jgi:hypothetical protein
MLATTTADKKSHFLDFQESEFKEKFPDLGFKIQHQLCSRPEFTLDRLAELAQRLPNDLVEYYAGDVPVAQRSKQYPKNGLSVVETVRQIEQCGSWMVLKSVHVDPVYNEILQGLLSEWYGQIDARQFEALRGKLHREHAFIFISSPNSVTPYHVDDEHNFLLQIRGSKKVSMWDPKDRVVLSESEVESQLQFWHDEDYERYVPYKEEFQERATVYNLNPGEGLHFPLAAPHWVKNGPEISISFSITFRSELAERLARIYYVNRRIRRRGLDPVPPMQSPWRDALKDGAFRVARKSSRLLKRGS